MKKCILAMLLCLSVLFLFACNNTPPDVPDDKESVEKKDPVVTTQESAIDVKTSALFSKKK